MQLSEDDQRTRRLAMPELFLATPHIANLGLVVERYEPDQVSTRLPFRVDLTNDGRVYHGGVVATAMDTTGALAAWSDHDFDRGVRAATVSISIQYVSAVSQGDLLCQAKTVRRARELIFLDVVATDAEGKVAAHAVQTYRIT